jgi:hypothetical protein
MKGTSTILWSIVIFGFVVAFGSYLGAIAPKSEYMRSVFIDDVRHDTGSAFLRRLMLGAGAGAVVGTLLYIRDKKSEKDDA